jgi:hypothetical protein
MPTQVGIHDFPECHGKAAWIPAFIGMTNEDGRHTIGSCLLQAARFQRDGVAARSRWHIAGYRTDA